MRKGKRHGFTLIELLVVITIIAVLASIAFPVYTTVQERARAAQDMSNLRQIAIATQMYMNDNDGVIFSSDASAGTWMSQLHPKYVATWKIFLSPFDHGGARTASEDDTKAPISYGLNGNTNVSSKGIIGLLSDKITNPSAFILFAPAQDSGSAVKFSGTPSAAVTVYKNTVASGGTHGNRTRINAAFADMHTESMPWDSSTSPKPPCFVNDSKSDTADPSAQYRWDP